MKADKARVASHRHAFEAATGGDARVAEYVRTVLCESKLSEASYANIFAMMYHVRPNTPDVISYSEADKRWLRNGDPISDLRVYALLQPVCDLVRAFVMCEWEDSVFSSFLSGNLLKEVEKTLDEMESSEHLNGILQVASALMGPVDTDSLVEWSEPEIMGTGFNFDEQIPEPD